VLAKLFFDTVHCVNIQDYSQCQVDAWAPGTIDAESWHKSLCSHNSFVAIENGEIVGFGDIDRTGYLDRLYVHHSYQHRGVGTALCKRLENSVSAQEITVAASITAKPFFERRGYKLKCEQIVERQGVKLKNYVMTLQRCSPANQTTVRKARHEEIPALVDIWERSVRATHHFLQEKDLQEIKRDMPTLYLPAVEVFVAVCGDRPTGFIGVSGGMIEMLFVDADSIGLGYGSSLLDFALQRGFHKVDVNEQNKSALKFYLGKGFRIVGRSTTDAQGRNYPILHLAIFKK